MAHPKRLFDIRRSKGVVIDGNIPHITMPHKGERYSVVFFAMRSRHKPMPETEARMHRQLGFPKFRAPSKCTGRVRGRLREANQILLRMGVPKRHIGDFENKRIVRR